MSLYKRKTGIWHYDFRCKGARYHGSTGHRDKRLAKAVEDQERERARAATTLHTQTDPTVLEATALYLAHKGQFEQNASTTETWLKWMVRDLGRDKRLSRITMAELHTIVAARRSRRKKDGTRIAVTNATVNRQFTELLRRVWRHTAPKIDQPDWKALLLREKDATIRSLPDDAVFRVRQHVRQDALPLFMWLLETGMRISEAINLRWQDIEEEGEHASVTIHGKRKAGSDEPRIEVIPLSHNMRAILTACRGHHPDRVFTLEQQRSSHGRRSGDRIIPKRRYVLDLFKQAYVAAGLPDGYGIHTLRHTAAISLLMQTGNLMLVKDLLGHSDIATTTRYARASKLHLRAALNAKSPDIFPTSQPETEKDTIKSKA